MVKIVKIKGKLDFEGIEIRICDVDESHNYIHRTEPTYVTRSIAPNGGIIPINIEHKDTIKTLIEKTISFLKLMVNDRGLEEVKKTLTEKIR